MKENTTPTDKTTSTTSLHGKVDANGKKLSPQNARLLKFLEKGKPITQAEAVNFLSIGRLAARIWELENWHGYTIDSTIVERVNRYNQKIHVGQYKLVK